ncbi:hypothetical protein IB265_32895 [Ensifer sp. ENS10]|uniref:hypothetical protein n=1 Tax=Ensifer sp. ENS10 TaxID=2769286 RepID=UPI001782BC95|nr:hypothetical protein [Ensifer sp. ENS10]MBD9511555.1 hypothetical protein [Ensifer sp. ENS10]
MAGRTILYGNETRSDFAGISQPERGFYVNVYEENFGTVTQSRRYGNKWPTRKDAIQTAKEQVFNREGFIRCAYRIRVVPKVAIPADRPPVSPMFFHPSFVMRGF